MIVDSTCVFVVPSLTKTVRLYSSAYIADWRKQSRGLHSAPKTLTVNGDLR